MRVQESLYNNITVGIKTFNRENKIRESLGRAAEFPFRNIIVCDDGDISSSKEKFYEQIEEKANFILIRPEYDVGLSHGRNLILEQTKTDYLLMLDDDQLIPENISVLKEILEFDVRIGGVSGYWREHGRIICQAHDTLVSGNVLVKTRPKRKMIKENGLKYLIADHIPNSTLFRVSCLKDSPWDPFYKIGYEHEDFYMQHKKDGVWAFAVTPEVVIDHVPDGEAAYDANYRQKPERLERSKLYFNKKWHLNGMIAGMSLKGWSPASVLIQLFLTLGVPGNVALTIKSTLSKVFPKEFGRGKLRRPKLS